MPSFLKSLKKAVTGGSDGGSKDAEDTGSPMSPTDASVREQVLKSITDGLPLHELYAHSNAKMHQDAHADGGIACKNEALLQEQRTAIQSWLASMGKRIFMGNFNLINTPMPVIMFEPRSYLEKLADVWVYPRYLQRASAAADPVERLKLVVTWFIAGLHHGFEKWKKPFNPILGETWQARLSDGSRIFMEQISHHPPVTAFNLHGPGGAYKFIGLSQPTVSITLKYYGFKTVAKGFRYLEFADGSRIDIQFPGYYVKGVVNPSLTSSSTQPRAEVDGSAVFTDTRNGLRAVLRFGPNKGARAPVLRRSDAVIGEIYRTHGAAAAGLQGAPDLIAAQPAILPAAGEDDLDGSNPDLAQLARSQEVASLTTSQPNLVVPCDSDGFETASESEFEMRELREQAERERGTESPVLGPGSHHQRNQSQARILANAAAAAVAATAREEGLLDDEELHQVSPTLHRLVPPPSASAPVLPTTRPPMERVSTESSHSTLPVRTSSSGLPLNMILPADVISPASAPVVANGRRPPSVNGWASTTAASTTAQKSSESGGWGFGKLMGMGGGGATAALAESDNQGEIVARIEGSWLSHINIDNCRYWTLALETPDRWVATPDALPSDVRHRDDLQWVHKGDLKLAQHWKEQLEKRQREDKKLREAGGAKIHTAHD